MSLKQADKEIANILKLEKKRQQKQLQMIPSENYASEAVLEAVGSVVMNKYSEGQVGKRYYQGNQFIDEIEKLAKERAVKAFGLDPEEWAVNVQAANGSTANLAVYLALLEPGDKIMGMYLYDGGHLSHGWKLPDGKVVSMTSKLFDSVFYSVEEDTKVFDYGKIRAQAKKEKPKLIISGGTAYPRDINYEKMGQIAHEIDAFYLADVAHEAGLVLAGTLSSPFKHADVVTMTTRKTLRGPVGALIFSRKELSKEIDRAVFPGLQGGPLNHSIAGIAVALYEAMQPEFKTYADKVVTNSKTLAKELQSVGFEIVSGGTDKHLLLIDLEKKGVDGWYTAWALDFAGIITNRSTVPYDKGSPYYPNGLRLGTPALTTRGMGEKEMRMIAKWIAEVTEIAKDIADDVSQQKDEGKIQKKRLEFKILASKDRRLKKINKEVENLCEKFPIY